MVGLNEQAARDARQSALLQKRSDIWDVDGFQSTEEEAALRFAEEALEAVHCKLSGDKDAILQMVDRVWGRPVGEQKQELGQASITLLMFAESVGVSLADAERVESMKMLNVVTDPPDEQVLKWRAKHKAKQEAGITYLSLLTQPNTSDPSVASENTDGISPAIG